MRHHMIRPDLAVTMRLLLCWVVYTVQDCSPLHNGKVGAESAGAGEEAAEGFLAAPAKLTVEGNDLPEQIFNMDDTSLFWKQMPGRTFTEKPNQCHGGQVYSFGGSVVGCRWKCSVIRCSENPGLQHISKHTPPVFCRSKEKSWLTSDSAIPPTPPLPSMPFWALGDVTRE